MDEIDLYFNSIKKETPKSTPKSPTISPTKANDIDSFFSNLKTAPAPAPTTPAPIDLEPVVPEAPKKSLFSRYMDWSSRTQQKVADIEVDLWNRYKKMGEDIVADETISGIAKSWKDAFTGDTPDGYGGFVAKETVKEMGTMFTEGGKGILDFVTKQIPKTVATLEKGAFESIPLKESGYADKARDFLVSGYNIQIDDITSREKERQEKYADLPITAPQKLGYGVGSGLASIGTSIAIGLVGKSKWGASLVLSALDGSDTYNRARENLIVKKQEEIGRPLTEEEKTTESAKAYGEMLVDTAGIAVLEKVGLDWLLSSRGIWSKAVLETVQESIQTIWSNLVEKYGDNEAKKITDGLAETIITTLPVGAISSGGLHLLDTKLQAQGLSPTESQDLINRIQVRQEEEEKKLKEELDGAVKEENMPEDQKATMDALADDIKQNIEEGQSMETIAKDLSDATDINIAQALDIVNKVSKNETLDPAISLEQIGEEAMQEITTEQNPLADTIGVRPEDLDKSIDDIFSGGQAEIIEPEKSKAGTPKTKPNENQPAPQEKYDKPNAFERESYVASQVGDVEEGYKRFEITVNGEEVFADFDYGQGIGRSAQTSHVIFQSKKEGPNPTSSTGYKSHFSNYSSEGKTDAEIKEDLIDLAKQFADEEAVIQKKNKKAEKKDKKTVPIKGVEKVSSKELDEFIKKGEKKTSKKNKSPDGWTATAQDTIWTKDTNSIENGFINIFALDDNGENKGTFRVSIETPSDEDGIMVKNEDGTDRLFNSLEEAIDYANQIETRSLRAMERDSSPISEEQFIEEYKSNHEPSEAGFELYVNTNIVGEEYMKRNTPWLTGLTREGLLAKYKELDNVDESTIIKTNDKVRQNSISDASDLPTGDNTGGSRKVAGEISRYDRATVLAESGNGLGPDGSTSLSKKDRQLINEQVEEILEAREYSSNPEDYSDDDINLMRAYTGAGGKESVGGEGAGLLNEYYTPPAVVQAMWTISDQLAPDIQTAFEPSLGIGNFIMYGHPGVVQIDGAEISKVSGTIAKILHPESNITIGDFQELFFDKKTNKQKAVKQYDLLIGNPPYGDRAGFLKGKGEESKINREEEYFIKRGLDMTKEGGLLVYVVNSSFLKTGSSAGKLAISQQGQLIDAYRLPENIFEDTSIGTDIVVFKKLSADKADMGSVRTVTVSDDMYFRANPNKILGETLLRKNRFGQTESYVKGDVEEAVKKIYADLGLTEYGLPVVTVEKAQRKAKEVKLSELAGMMGIPFQEIKVDNMETIGEIAETAENFTEFKEDVQDKYESKEAIEGILEDNGFNDLMEVFDKAKEPVAEVVEQKEEKTTKTKSNKKVKPPKFSQVIQAKGAKGTIPVQNISNKTNYSPVELNMLKRIDRDLAVPSPTSAEMPFLNYAGGEYFNDGIYYAGEIYEKLTQLENDKQNIIAELGQEQYDKQKKGLEAIIPKPINIKDIAFDPLDRHIAEIETTNENGDKTTVINEFYSFIRHNDVALSPRVSKWDVLRFAQQQTMSKGTKPIMGYIKSDARRLFNQFLKNELNPEAVQKIEEKYNKEKNGYIQPDYTKLPVEIKDMSATFRGNNFQLSETQKNGVGFLVNKGSGLIAYGVGVGKTHTLAIATVANMQKGWTKRPLFVVPKSTITKTWLATLQEMFPTLTINNLGGLQAPIVARLMREKGEDKTKWISDGELSVISHEGILRLGLKEDELRQATEDLKDALWVEPKTKRGGEKDKNVYDEIAGNAQKYVTDTMISDLGFDHISVDEVHNFRKVFQGAKAEQMDDSGKPIPGAKKRYSNILGGTPSRRAQQLFLLSQYIQKNNNNRNVFLASATPFENQATEVYNILSFIARDRMKAMGIMNINDFFASFANFEVELDRKLDGEWINREKMKSFSNLPTLQGLLKEFIDFQVDPTLVRPERVVLTPHLAMGDLQIKNLAKIQALLTGVQEEAEDEQGFAEDSKEFYGVAEAMTPKELDDGAFLKASTYSIANSVSPYFINEYTKTPPTPQQLVDESPKIKYAIETLRTIKANKKTKDFGTFLFFGKMGVEYHPMIADYITKELGYKKGEVAVLSGDVTDDQKEDIKEKFNDGRVKVLLGGDQTKEGIDLQNNGFITINLALGWNPTQISQVEGRVWRQGNKRSIAPLIYPLVENSGDATIFNKFEEKGGRINDLFSYKGKMFDVGEIDPAEKKLALLTEPKDKAKMQIEIDKTIFYNERLLLENDIKELKNIQADQNQIKDDIEYSEKVIADKEYPEDRVKQEKKDLKRYKDKLARLDEKVQAKGITDINQAINDLEIKIVEQDAKIKAIDDTMPEKLAFFTEQYREYLKNRKTMADHMNDIQGLVDKVQERTQAEVDAIRAKLIAEVEAKRRAGTPEFETIEKTPDLTLKTLDRIGYRKTVSKQFIADLARKADIKLVEKNLIEEALKDEPATVDVVAFKKKVLAETLPLTRDNRSDDFNDDFEDAPGGIYNNTRYSSIVLPEEERGAVIGYSENIYESTIETTAGNTHFGRGNFDGERVYPKGYFGHTRTENMDGEDPNLATRRVIEVQSDLYQKGNLERETKMRVARANEDIGYNIEKEGEEAVKARFKEAEDKAQKEVDKLSQYNDPTAHFRMVREEIKQASKDGITRLQFPTGETAMKIEGLGDNTQWFKGVARDGDYNINYDQSPKLTTEDLKVGLEVNQSGNSAWIITDVLGDGKFKAIPKKDYDIAVYYTKEQQVSRPDFKIENSSSYNNRAENFDISGKIDTQNPIYKFYQNELSKYLHNKYEVVDVTDKQGVTWWEVQIKPEMATTPVEAFQKENGPGLMSFEQAKAKLEAYKKRLNLDFDVDFAHTIFTGTAKGERAYAVTYNNKITLTDNVKASTADHEMVHLVMNNIEKISAFDGITREQLLKAANGGKTYTETQVNALNEQLAEGFQAMVEGAEQSSVPMVMRRFYEKLKTLWTNFLKSLGKEIDIIQDFYSRLISATNKEKVRLENQKELDRQVQFNTINGPILAFNEARAEFMRKTRVDFEKIAENYSVDLKRRDLGAIDELLAQSRDLYLKDKEEFKEADSLMKIGDERRMKKSILDKKFADMLKPYFGLKDGDLLKVNEVLMEGDKDAVEYSDFQLKNMGLSQEQIDGYKATRKAFNVAHELLLSEMEASGVKPEEIDTFRAERIGYMPHKWKYRFAIKTQILKTGFDPKERSSWFTTSMDVYKSAKEVDKVFAEKVKNNKVPERVRYVNDTLDSLDVDFFSEQKFSFENMKSIVTKAKMASEVKAEMMIGLRNMIKEKGFGRNFIKRTGIKGYEKKEVSEIVANYFSGLNGFITKMEAGKQYYKVLENIDARRQKRFYSWVRDSIAYDMGNMVETVEIKIPKTKFTGEMTIDLKQIAFVYYLANDLSFLLTNTTQNLIVGIGELSKLVDGAGKAYKGETALLKATTDWAMGNITADEKLVITKLIEVGKLGGEMTAELMGFKNNPIYRTISNGLNKALYNTTTFVEQNINRVPAFLAARRLLKEKGMSDKEANEQALAVSEDINFRYGKQHRPVFMRGKKGVAFVFTHYIRSFLYQLARDLGNKEFASFSKKMFYTTLIGGTSALPFAELVKAILKKIFGDDDDEETIKELGSIELAFERGVPASLLNVDLSDRVGINILLFSNIFDELGQATTIKEKVGNVLFSFTGATGGLLFDRLPKGVELINKGRYLEAMGKLLPDFLGSPFKAFSGATEGVQSQSGNPLIDENGNRFKYTTLEGFIRATGFTPTREQIAWDEKSKEWDLKNKESAGNAEVRDKINRMVREGDTEGARKYQEEARKSGELSSSFDYVRKNVKDDVMRDNLETWETGPQTRMQLNKIEKEIAKEMYGEKYTNANLTFVAQDFGFRRAFGYNDKNANDVYSSSSNKDKVLILKNIREEMGADAFREWFNKGRKTVTLPSGNTSYVLISDDLKELYIKSQ